MVAIVDVVAELVPDICATDFLDCPVSPKNASVLPVCFSVKFLALVTVALLPMLVFILTFPLPSMDAEPVTAPVSVSVLALVHLSAVVDFVALSALVAEPADVAVSAVVAFVAVSAVVALPAVDALSDAIVILPGIPTGNSTT